MVYPNKVTKEFADYDKARKIRETKSTAYTKSACGEGQKPLSRVVNDDNGADDNADDDGVDMSRDEATPMMSSLKSIVHLQKHTNVIPVHFNRLNRHRVSGNANCCV